MSESEEIKDLGSVQCPKCKAIVLIKKRTTYNQKEPRRKITEELYAEDSMQTTLT